MLPEITQLRNELAKSNNHEPGFLRGCIADLIKDKAARNLLNICLNAGVLQDFFHEATHDTFFIRRCKNRLIEEFFITESAAEKAVGYCKFLAGEETEIKLIPYRKGNKWGFCTPDKKIVIECIYDNADPFINGFARVELDNEMVEIDVNINVYKATHRFPEKLWMDQQNGKLGFIDFNDNIVIPHKYDIEFSEFFEFTEGLVGVRKGNKWGFINKSDEIIIPFIYEDWGGDFIKKSPCFDNGIVHVKKNNKWGFIDRQGKIVIPFIYDYFDDLYTGKIFSNGLGNMKKNGKWGYIDRKGNVIIPFIYDRAAEFREGLASIEKENKFGFIDNKGHIIIPFIYDHTRSFSEELAVVIKDNKTGFIDKEGNVTIPFIYDNADSFSEGLAAVIKDYQYGFINKEGKVVIPIIYDGVESFSNGLAKVFTNNTGIAGVATFEMKMIGYIDTKGTQYWGD